jgi:ABC-2 type transport system permease protein
MLRGLWRLSWLEVKIFVREPMGVLGTIGIPVIVFIALGRLVGARVRMGAPGLPSFLSMDLPIFAALLVPASAIMSLIVIVAIYREGGILKRLRATPLRAHTILTAHVLVKLLSTAVTLALMFIAGRRYYPTEASVPIVSFALGLLFCTACIISLGFLIASIVPTARFAQPIGAIIIYPMLGICGLFRPVEALPAVVRAVARILPFTYAVSLLRGILQGEGWLRHAGDIAALVCISVVCTIASTRVFRWE